MFWLTLYSSPVLDKSIKETKQPKEIIPKPQNLEKQNMKAAGKTFPVDQGRGLDNKKRPEFSE